MSPSLSANKPSSQLETEPSGVPALFANLAFGGLGLWLLAAPSQFSNHWPTDYNFWPQSLALLLLGGVALLQSVAGLKARFEAVGLCLALFLGWNLIATSLGVYKHDAWLELARITGCVFVFFAVRAQNERTDGLVIAAVVGALYPALGALFDFFQLGGRQFAGYLNPNLFAAMLVPAMVLSLLIPVLVWRRTRSAPAAGFSGGAAVVLLMALAVTGSKGGFVAALVALLVFGAAVVRAKGAIVSGSMKRAWPILLVAFLVMGAVVAKSVGPRLLQAGGSDNNSTQFRVYAWRSTIEMVKTRRVFGFGPDAFPTVYPRFAQVGYTRTAHQSWLQIAAEGGVPALLFLLGAFTVAARAGWQRLKTEQWAYAACGLGALAGVLVHGCFDAGWSITPVVALLCVALALCIVDGKPKAEEIAPSRRGLNFAFLGMTILLVLGGYGTQKAANGEDLRAQADEALRRGQATNAINEAVATDASSARLWNFVGRATPLDNREAWEGAFRTAARLQPDSASHLRAWATQLSNLPAPTPRDVDREGELLDRALVLDPLNSTLRLERAKWRLDHKNGHGYEDLEFILKQWDEPYGKYPALGRDIEINLDFARATLALAPRLKAQKQTARLQTLVKRALEDVAAARGLQKANAAMMEAMGGQGSLNQFGDLDSLESGLKAFS
ncbi:hypothetical protein EON83_24450 [bacterium]|nr:MAG: hypothetical protein EON83_24450 [bacterium]